MTENSSHFFFFQNFIIKMLKKPPCAKPEFASSQKILENLCLVTSTILNTGYPAKEIQSFILISTNIHIQ